MFYEGPHIWVEAKGSHSIIIIIIIVTITIMLQKSRLKTLSKAIMEQQGVADLGN